ncbi:gp50 [Mycobacterium phage Corndog]|uniref:Uncharacterized protein n=5 Tax=Corndogvirus TaxID=1623285 RepID=Q856P4_BPMCO|nr:gp50 [Mycobacterium phage Corndog]AAN01982.1 hypothetical protein PBI_CORNDOG_50 [Mycobacterium phage Corndog]
MPWRAMIEKTLWTLGGTAAVLVTCALVWIRSLNRPG